MDCLKYSDQTYGVEVLCLYHILEKAYDNKKILIYSGNRLIFSLDFTSEMLCGVIDLKSNVEISIGKCSI